MNKIYKLKYDRRRNQLVAVSELTTGAGKETTGQITAQAGLADIGTFRKLMGTLTPLAFLTGLVISLLPGMALANPDLPVGGQIVAGQGSISTNGNQMTINQNTHGMVTNWNSFDIGKNHTVQFVQPDSSAVALNRVTGGHESQILGTLTANGQVMLVNPAGVMFGKGAKVNTAGLVASTKNISNADFMVGHYTFSGGGNPGAEVVNQGNLTTTKGGYIVLAADRVKNSGTIRTPGGKAVLAAGETVTLQLDNTGLASVSVTGSVVNALVENHGLLSATDGQVYLTARGKDMLLNTVVNNSGTVEATGLTGQGGEIVLNGGDSGVVNQSGMLLADSSAGRGGKITVEGQNIHLAANSRTSATGNTGGGEVYVGGGWQGRDSRIHNASKVVMDKTATVDVSATERGNGGTAVLWSDDYTNFRGTIFAKGGLQSGNGGKVETSSHRNLQASGDADASAPAGHGGEWLLDPTDVTIVSGDDNISVSETGKGTEASTDSDTDHIFSPSESGAQVSATKISAQLNNGTSVTVDTHGEGEQKGNITFGNGANISKTTGGDAALTLEADGNIVTPAGISVTSTQGKLNLNMLAGNDSGVTLGRNFMASLNGGNFYAGPRDAGNGGISFTQDNNGYIQAGDITIDAVKGYTDRYASLKAAGNLTVNAPVKVSLPGGWGINLQLTAGDTVTLHAKTGDISLDSSSVTNGTAAINISGVNGVDIRADNGFVSMSSLGAPVGGKTGTLTLSSSDGNISVSSARAYYETDGSNSILALNNISINATKGSIKVNGSASGGLQGLTSTGMNITSAGSTELSGSSQWGGAANLSGLNLTSVGDITVTGASGKGAWSTGLKLSGSNITSTTGNISLTGLADSDPANANTNYGKNGLEIVSSTITAGTTQTEADGAENTPRKITLNGTASNKTGVRVTGSTFTADAMDVLGMATGTNGVGLSFGSSHLNGALTDLTNVTFSSAGSVASATNSLDSSIVTADNSETLMSKWHPENQTTLDLGGAAIFDDSNEDTKGWTADFTSETTPNGGWIFNNTSVTAAGDVNLKGAGFTRSTITVSDGNFSLTNAGLVMLNDDTINVTGGGIDAHSLSGSVNLTRSNISANNDINLTADNGIITLMGGGSGGVTSSEGNISMSANTSSGIGVSVININLSARDAIHVDGVSKNNTGVLLTDSSIKSSSDSVYINGKARSFYEQKYQEAGVLLKGNITLSASNGTKITAINYMDTTGYAPPAGLVMNTANVTFIGGGRIDATSPYAAIIAAVRANISNSGGNLTINATVDGTAKTGPTGGASSPPSGAFVMDNVYNTVFMGFNSGENSNINIIADTTGDKKHRLPGMAAVTPDSTGAQQNTKNGFIFNGAGNISVTGKSWLSDGVNTRHFDNHNMTGVLTINGDSEFGTGVVLDKQLDVNVSNAKINGTSNNGSGVLVISNSGDANLQNNIITGISCASDGVGITGNNITVTNGLLHGSSGGGGAGVVLTGGSKYILDGVNVIGNSVNGAGVSVQGNLALNSGTVLNGTATGSGSGVAVSGNLTNTEGDNTQITGAANSGDGIRISGSSSLVNATLTGTSSSG
ncbi:filamentous hemagglutinin N-terminal domain-containing protein, partial [Salmonella enterica]|nr:filamentous hemagglutinin N-terminal domain-containing protein [Salmonella enterica]